MHVTAKFRHAMFNRSEDIVLTDKQTDAAENIRYAMPVDKNSRSTR